MKPHNFVDVLENRMELPESVSDFPDFIADRLAREFLHAPLTDRSISQMKSTISELLALGASVYAYWRTPEFWNVSIKTDLDGIGITILPKIFDGLGEPIVETTPEGVWARLNEYVVMAPTEFEAMIALAHLLELHSGARRG